MFKCVPDLQVLADCAVILLLLKESCAIFVLFLQKFSSMFFPFLQKPRLVEDTPLTFVSTVIELSSVIDKLRKEHIVAVDLEVSMSLDFFD